MSLPQVKHLSVGERISALSLLPAWPEENWRRTDPELFFLPEGDVVNNFGQSVLGAHLASSPYKVQFKVLSAEALQVKVSSLVRSAHSSAARIANDEAMDVSRVVLLELGNGGLVVSSCAQSDSWVGRLEIGSRPSRPESVLRDSAVCAALAERLQVSAPSELIVRIPSFEHTPVVLVAVECEPAFAQSYANITLDVADGAAAELAVLHGSASFSYHRVTIRAGRGSAVTQLWAHLGNESDVPAHMLFERKVILAARAQFFDASVFVPSSVLRVVSNVTPEGDGAIAQCGTAIVASGYSVIDYEPLQDHTHAHAQTHLRAKVIAGQRGKAVFQGLVNVEREAVGTNASQVNKNLVLSKRARVDSMPRLRILPDEVSCKHGSATGEIDAKQIHYLMTRGFSEMEAKELVVRGFVLEGLLQLPEASPLFALASDVLSQGLDRVLR